MPQLVWPAWASTAKLKLVTPIRTRLISTERFMPSRAQERAAQENADQIGPEADADVIDGDLVIAESQIVEQQPDRELAESVSPILCSRMNSSTRNSALPREELDKRPARWRAGPAPMPF